MPLFQINSDNFETTTEQSQAIVLSPSLAEGTETQPTLVRIPSTTPTNNVPNLFPSLGSTSFSGSISDDRLASLLDPPSAVREEPISAIASTTTSVPLSAAAAQRRVFEANTTPGGIVEATGAMKTFMDAIATIESSHNYNAVGPETRWGTAKGKYQFIDATWRTATKRVPGASRYRTALEAPPSVQEAVAKAHFEFLLTKYRGDWALVAIAHHGGIGTADKVLRTGSTGARDVLNTTSMDYARRALRISGLGSEAL